MRPWKLKSILVKDKPIFGLGWVQDPVILEVAGELGLDFAIPDMEHTDVYDFPTLFHLMRAGDATGLACLVRVPTPDHTVIMKVLDSGAEGILVAHCNSKEDAIKAVQATRYPPEGIRGATGTRRPTVYGARAGDRPEFYKESNANVLVCLLIEEKRAVDNIDEIVSVKGVDAVYPGLFDLSMSMGLWGERTKAVLDAREKVMAACRRKGVPLLSGISLVPGADKDPVGAIKEFIKDGGRIISLGSAPQADPWRAKSIMDKVKASL